MFPISCKDLMKIPVSVTPNPYKQLVQLALCYLGEATLTEILYTTGECSPKLYGAVEEMINSGEINQTLQEADGPQTAYFLSPLKNGNISEI